MVKSQLYILISNKIGDGFGKWCITYLDLYYIHSLVFLCFAWMFECSKVKLIFIDIVEFIGASQPG